MTSGISPGAGVGRPRITSQVVFGLMLVVAGVLFTLDNLEIFVSFCLRDLGV